MNRLLFLVLIIHIPINSIAVEITTGSYKLETRLLLPHLEEMRRTISTAVICIEKNDVTPLFPILKQPGMMDCSLIKDKSTDVGANYVLRCPGKNAAKGIAILKQNDNEVSAELNAKMGGKNMTFSQFSNAVWQGPCAN